MIEVHHLENSRSQRVLWLLEELELEYRVVEYRRDPQTMLAPDSLKRVHPLGKAPVVVDGDVTLAESGAIIDYLVETYDTAGRLTPSPTTPEWRAYRYWLHYAEGSAMPLLVMSLVFTRLAKPPVPALMRPFGRLLGNGVKAQYLEPRLREHLDFWEQTLSATTWFAGETFSAADIQMSFPLLACESRGGLGDRPHLEAFMARMRERPTYRRAVEKGGEFSL
ncbi:glutathione S-transferase [Modicisalibacter coralii]|uniref:glutathione S-transferase n=1 Tax=Modicisalibacter coralii TaxID=2304602 RepID=UPI00100BC829|nr:glutathione S-transferase [Halomonas coralii]